MHEIVSGDERFGLNDKQTTESPRVFYYIWFV
jgi:hypothetical protein